MHRLSSVVAAGLMATIAFGQTDPAENVGAILSPTLTQIDRTALLAATAVATGDEVAIARELFVSGDYAAALPALIAAADAGNARAQNLVGAAYQYGNGVPLDAAQTLHYLTMSADQTFPPAIHNLGYLYSVGMQGLPQDPARAREYFVQSAALDYGPSLSSLGVMLLNGTGGPVDEVTALRLFARGASLGDPDSVEWLAYVHVVGRGVPKDHAAARAIYEVAIGFGSPTSDNSLGMLLGDGLGGPADLPRAYALFERAVAAGNVDAGINVAWLIFDNGDVFPDQVEGLAYCFWAVANTGDQSRAEFQTACDDVAATYSASDVRMAEKLALRM